MYLSALPSCVELPIRLLQQTPQFCDLLVKGAHKTWGDAAAEVREAVDFLR